MRYFFAIILFVCSINLKAQIRGKITGKVIDSLTQKGVDYASVGLFKSGTTKPIDGLVSDAKGNFTLSNVKNGEYKITIDFIGYKRKVIDHLKIDDAHELINLLIFSSHQLLIR